jgi:hypothetical protein
MNHTVLESRKVISDLAYMYRRILVYMCAFGGAIIVHISKPYFFLLSCHFVFSLL